jgi:hypothetical protein
MGPATPAWRTLPARRPGWAGIVSDPRARRALLPLHLFGNGMFAVTGAACFVSGSRAGQAMSPGLMLATVTWEGLTGGCGNALVIPQ